MMTISVARILKIVNHPEESAEDLEWLRKELKANLRPDLVDEYCRVILTLTPIMVSSLGVKKDVD